VIERLLGLYPRAWRERYGEEVAAFVERDGLSLRVVLDLISGAVAAHLRPELAVEQLAFVGAPDGRTFIPGVGFRDAGVRLKQPVSLEREGRTVTVVELVSSAQRTDLTYEFTWLSGESDALEKFENATLRADSRDYRGDPGSTSARPGKIVREVVMAPLPAHLRAVELRLTGGTIGDWSARLELRAFPEEAAPAGRALDATDTHEGITIHVRSIAVTPESTAVELEVTTNPPVLLVEGIGGYSGMREGATALTLRDGAGRVFPERVVNDIRDKFPNQYGREVALFDPLPADARGLELEVPFVIVSEEVPDGPPLVLPVETPVDVWLGSNRVRVLRSRPADAANPWHRGAALGVDLELGDWQGNRRVLTPGQAIVDGKSIGVGLGRGIHGPAPEPLDYIELRVDDPGAARSLQLGMPTVQVRGPWRIKFERTPP
jgi:hypothetical protein